MWALDAQEFTLVENLSIYRIDGCIRNRQEHFFPIHLIFESFITANVYAAVDSLGHCLNDSRDSGLSDYIGVKLTFIVKLDGHDTSQITHPKKTISIRI